MTADEVAIRPLAPDDWSAVEQLFGANGACGGCWCMFWRVPSTGRYWAEHKGEPNRQSFQALVQSGKAQGVLAFGGKTAVGWCSLGWKDDFPYLQRSRALGGEIDKNTMCVTCFFIPARWRGRGLATRLLVGAVEHARALGAEAIEGYPSIPKAAGVPIPPAFAHTGVPPLFEAAGFTRLREAGARAVYRLPLD